MDTAESLLWVDVETTGLNARSESLLQVAAVITDPDLTEISPFFERVIRHDNAAELRAGAAPIVQSMHDETGLWSRLADGDPVSEVDADLFDFMLDAGFDQPRMLRLGGSSCSLDMDFMEVYLPKSASHLHYRIGDVSSLAYFMNAWGITDGFMPKRKAHNAVDDIRESIAEARWIRDRLKSAARD